MELMSRGHYITDQFGPYRRVFLPFGGLVTKDSVPKVTPSYVRLVTSLLTLGHVSIPPITCRTSRGIENRYAVYCVLCKISHASNTQVLRMENPVFGVNNSAVSNPTYITPMCTM